MIKTLKEKQATALKDLHKEFGYSNAMQAPRILKVVLSSGVGSIKDKKKVELVGNRLSAISGQKSALRTAKKSIASFKSREGDTVGFQVTLRGDKMWNFLEKLVNVALPRTKDFRGVNRSIVDDIGNMTIGIKEHTIFPETADEDIKDVFGLSVTVVSSAKTKKEGFAFYELLGMPFKKEEEKKKK
jgi:large subunit ribosomal protein L5